MLEKLKNRMHQDLDALFATAAVDEMAGDMQAYRAKLDDISKIAEILGIETDIICVSIKMKDDWSNGGNGDGKL